MSSNEGNGKGGGEASPRKIPKLEAAGAEEAGAEDKSPADLAEEEEDAKLMKAFEGIEAVQREIDLLNGKVREENPVEGEAQVQVQVQMAPKEELLKEAFERRNELIAKVKEFWITAIGNHPRLEGLLEEEGVETCLQSLTKMEVEEFEDTKPGFRITLYFSENEFFENRVLVKEFQLGDEPKSTSTEIHWKNGKDLTKPEAKAPAPVGLPVLEGEGSGETRTFFGWLNDHTNPLSDDVATAFKDDLWARPLDHYMGFNLVSDGSDDEDYSSDDEDEIPFDDNEDEEEDELDEDDNED